VVEGEAGSYSYEALNSGLLLYYYEVYLRLNCGDAVHISDDYELWARRLDNGVHVCIANSALARRAAEPPPTPSQSARLATHQLEPNQAQGS